MVTILMCFTVTAMPVRTLDGDTFEALIPIWFGLTAQERVRVLGVDTPELRGPTKPTGLQAKAFTEAWLAKGSVEISACDRDSFGRVLGRVLRNGDNLADLLIQAGLGSPR